MNRKYGLALEKAEKLYGNLKPKSLPDDFDSREGILDYLVQQNSFENPLPRYLAELIIEDRQKTSLDTEGGYPLWLERSFKIGPGEFSVIAFGASNDNEGKDAISGIFFVEENHMKLSEICGDQKHEPRESR